MGNKQRKYEGKIIMERAFKGVWIPKDIWEDREVHPISKAIYAYFIHFAVAENNNLVFYADKQKMVKDFNLSKPTLSKHINQLVDLDYIELDPDIKYSFKVILGGEN